ncbi:hypothetical protein Bhyg_05410 [Pseudolycoriella hygida]|uniref:Uncharacterized protein n=1 Tax=Pseudolycoriella hygida TaxID=35572 RepID=A0A9Q0SAN3_9DIPT|nr:hypothetical protein Bhyg_05410 [Pseudolycoriella hygida]
MASDLPETILKKSETAVKALGPEKSSKRYDETYNRFIDWRKQQGTESFVEEVFLAYFEDKSQHYAPSTLWSIYSMLKSKMIANHNIDISRYSRLLTFVKTKNVGFQSKQTSVFTPEEIKKFLLEAPDSEFLVIKAVTVFGISGGCRGEEICNVMLGHVKDTGSEIVVRIPESKTYTAKLFPILTDAGATLEETKRFYYWKSNTVVERYIQDSLGQKRTLATTITKALDLNPDDVIHAKIAKSSSTEMNDIPPLNSAANDSMKTHRNDANIDAAAGVLQNEIEDNSNTVVNVDVHNVADNDKENFDFGNVRPFALSQSVNNNEKSVGRKSLKINNCKHVTISFGNGYK